jgi:xanthine dehydrogenase molybdenum-binding subunit
MCIAQIQGAAQMGCGAALRESVTVGADGRCTDSLSRYHLCLAPDLPEIRVELLTGGRSQDGPFGAKSVGEVCYVPTAPAVCGAVNDALDSEMGVLPFTPDAILNYLAKERNR